jgi:hypothetical protein
MGAAPWGMVDRRVRGGGARVNGARGEASTALRPWELKRPGAGMFVPHAGLPRREVRGARAASAGWLRLPTVAKLGLQHSGCLTRRTLAASPQVYALCGGPARQGVSPGKPCGKFPSASACARWPPVHVIVASPRLALWSSLSRPPAALAHDIIGMAHGRFTRAIQRGHLLAAWRPDAPERRAGAGKIEALSRRLARDARRSRHRTHRVEHGTPAEREEAAPNAGCRG